MSHWPRVCLVGLPKSTLQAFGYWKAQNPLKGCLVNQLVVVFWRSKSQKDTFEGSKSNPSLGKACFLLFAGSIPCITGRLFFSSFFPSSPSSPSPPSVSCQEHSAFPSLSLPWNAVFHEAHEISQKLRDIIVSLRLRSEVKEIEFLSPFPRNLHDFRLFSPDWIKFIALQIKDLELKSHLFGCFWYLLLMSLGFLRNIVLNSKVVEIKCYDFWFVWWSYFVSLEGVFKTSWFRWRVWVSCKEEWYFGGFETFFFFGWYRCGFKGIFGESLKKIAVSIPFEWWKLIDLRDFYFCFLFYIW